MAKKDENKPSDKEVYELWWEYLKRSEKYKLFCDLSLKASEDGCDVFGDSFFTEVRENESFIALFEGEYPGNGYQVFKTTRCMQTYYFYYGNIFRTSFDEWWEKGIPDKAAPKVLVLNDPKTCKYLSDFAEQLQERQEEKKEPLSSEETLQILAESEPEFIYLAVPMVGGVTIEDISKQIADIRKERRMDFVDEEYYARKCIKPGSRVRLGEMQRYLQVYDLWKQGLKMKDIVANIDPNRRGENVLRSFRADLQKAKKIIRNVEGGFFPDVPPEG